mmetsp:Transcript_21777/g.19292  ORF Transcript_21777/g.19292 Transcript_21777/m.19292 type:complete len:113 (+) Transcript_21777:474-812(+)
MKSESIVTYPKIVNFKSNQSQNNVKRAMGYTLRKKSKFGSISSQRKSVLKQSPSVDKLHLQIINKIKSNTVSNTPVGGEILKTMSVQFNKINEDSLNDDFLEDLFTPVKVCD